MRVSPNCVKIGIMDVDKLEKAAAVFANDEAVKRYCRELQYGEVVISIMVHQGHIKDINLVRDRRRIRLN